MNNRTNPSPTLTALLAALAAAFTLTACQPAQDAPSAGAPADAAAGATALGDKAVNAASDAAITVAVNAALARDEQLKVLRIDVDTVDGHVVLDGSAPDAAARQRATQLARNIDGVKSVDNRLAVPPMS